MVTLLLSFDLSSGSTSIVIPSNTNTAFTLFGKTSMLYFPCIYQFYLASKNIVIETPR